MSTEKINYVWPEWKVVGQLGEGSYGKVYRVMRSEHGVTSNAAVKVISIPQNEAELASMRAEGLDEVSAKTYFKGIVTDFISEVKLMESMKGTSNIVSIEDFKVLERRDRIGWDILIRMELLMPLNNYIATKSLSETDIVKLGQHVCAALELCVQRNIIHRDIKPENIFVSQFGDFKVGDFGIARELSKTGGSLSQKGTYNYMAPEVRMSKHYGPSVDTYSLGLVLYKLLNNNRLPFLNPFGDVHYQDRVDAINRRFSGEPLPKPINASPRMAQVIIAACSFNPAQRFKTPTAMKNALGTVLQQPNNSGERGMLDASAGMQPGSIDAARGIPPGNPHMPVSPGDFNTITSGNQPAGAFGNTAQGLPMPIHPNATQRPPMPIHPNATQHPPMPIHPNATQRPPMHPHNNPPPFAQPHPFNQHPGGHHPHPPGPYTQHQAPNIPGKKKKSAGKRIAIILIILLVLGGGAFGVYYFNPGGIVDRVFGDPVDAVIAALEEGNYAEAVALAADIDSDRLMPCIAEWMEIIEPDFFHAGDYDAAIRRLDAIADMNIQGLYGNISAIRTWVTDLNASREAFTRARELYHEGHIVAISEQQVLFASAIDYFGLVIRADTNYDLARQGILDATNAYRDAALAFAELYSLEGNFAQAIFILEEALQIVQNDAAILNQIDAYSEALIVAPFFGLIHGANEFALIGDWRSAILTYRAALEGMEADPLFTLEADQLILLMWELNSWEQQYAAATIDQANILIEADNHVEAAALINATLQTLPDNEELLQLLEYASNIRPLSLLDLTPINSSGWNPNEGELEDSLGHVHETDLPYIVFSHGGSAEFFVEGEFSTLRGTIAPHTSMWQDGNIMFMVFADDRLVYSTPSITRTTLAIDFEADVSGAQFIRVEARRPGGSAATAVLIMGMTLESAANDTVSERPRSLLELNPVNSGDWGPNWGILEDSFGNQYFVTSPYIVARQGSWAEFFVNSEYSILRGRLVPHYSMGQDITLQFAIYADDERVYTSDYVTRATLAFEFEAEINDAQFIRITVSRTGGMTAATALMMDLFLE